MTTIILALAFGVFLAYSNGANDNFKGVATLFGSGTTTHRRALAWATLTTLAGSFAALVLARGLLASFSGRGLVPDHVVAMQSFSLAVPLAAALTVFLATRLGFPISTTHALTGALVGAGVLASPSGVNYSKLGSAFFAPLLMSPFVAIASTALVYWLYRFAKARLGFTQESCACIGIETVAAVPASLQPSGSALYSVASPALRFGTEPECRDSFVDASIGVKASQVTDALHFLSSGIVSFARGLNDTPKIAALLVVGGGLSPNFSIVSVALAIAIGGLLQSAKIAEIMSHGVTKMSADQGLAANVVTGGVVLIASHVGVPVSTTHVSCGSLFGIGAVTGQGHWRTILSILLAWVTTLPAAAVLGAVSFALLKGGFSL